MPDIASGTSNEEELSLAELTERVGVSVRNVRFYTTRGLVPPPIRRGRLGYYNADHIARLELVRELQSHGFTLAAIEKYLADLPSDATPADIAVHRTMLAPWQGEAREEMTRPQLEKRAGRALSDAEIETLGVFGIARPSSADRFLVSVIQLPVGVALIDLGLPLESAKAAGRAFAAHGRALAQELDEIFRTIVSPAYQGSDPDTLRQVVEKLKPLTVASLVGAYESAMKDLHQR